MDVHMYARGVVQYQSLHCPSAAVPAMFTQCWLGRSPATESPSAQWVKSRAVPSTHSMVPVVPVVPAVAVLGSWRPSHMLGLPASVHAATTASLVSALWMEMRCRPCATQAASASAHRSGASVVMVPHTSGPTGVVAPRHRPTHVVPLPS